MNSTSLPNSLCADTQKTKQEPEEMQHQDELHMDSDGAYTLYDDHHIKEEMVVSPTIFHKPATLCLSSEMTKKIKLESSEEEETQSVEKTNQVAENVYELGVQYTQKNPVRGSKITDISVRVADGQQEVFKKAVRPKSKVITCRTANNAPNVKVPNQGMMTAENNSLPTFSCDICDFSTNNPKYLNIHLESHADAINKCCYLCSYNNLTSSKSTLVKYLRTTFDDEPYSCASCHKSFYLKSRLDIPQQTHTGEKLFSCDVCFKSFNQKSNLNTHRRIHTGEKLLKSFSCDVCNKNFRDSYTLRNHRGTHTGENPYLCDFCHKGFSQKSNLNKHLRTHTGEKPFSCSLCNKSFKQKSHLKTHLLTHKVK